jgi:hypothetical protein
MMMKLLRLAQTESRQELAQMAISLEEGATPHDYLEKIFQIPFWLRPMNATSCIEFLDGLTLDIDTTTSAPKDEKTMVVVEPQTSVATETPALVEPTDSDYSG